jgi:HK97 family phage major capsid protein
MKTEVRHIPTALELGERGADLADYRDSLTAFMAEYRSVRETAEAENRSLTDDESKKRRALEREMEAIEEFIKGYERENHVSGLLNRAASGGENLARSVALRRDQSLAAQLRARGLVPEGHEDLSLAKCLRGVMHGDWKNAAAEQRAMAEGVLGSGGFAVPTYLAAQIIDLARNQAAVFQAGAVTVPMESQTEHIARWASDPTATWVAENVAVTESEPTLERVQLQAKMLACLTRVSWELLEDSNPSVEVQLRKAFAAVFAIELDRVALYGTGTDPQPRGIKNTTGVTILTNGANGTAIGTLKYGVIGAAIRDLANRNVAPNAAIVSPRTDFALGDLVDTTGQPLQAPSYIAGVPRYRTNQVPNNLTVGTSSDTSDAFVADFTQLLVGMRHMFSIEVLRERYAEFKQVGFLAHLRADVALARPTAFDVVTGIRP